MSIPNRNNLSDKMLRLDKTLFIAVQYPCEILPSEQLTLFLFFKFPRILVIQCINRTVITLA